MFKFSRTAPKPPRGGVIESRQIAVAGRELPLTVVEHRQARRLTLRIEAGGRGVRVTVPPGVGSDETDRFIERHHGWLAERIAKLPDKPQVRAGIKVPIRGVPHQIVHVAGKRGVTTATRDAMGPVLLVYGDKTRIGARVADFLKKQARVEIGTLVETHTKSVGRRARSVKFRDTVSRWGSCSADGNLSFSWRIMMAPPAVIDYLVAHEVAHLKEMNHGPEFWNLCKRLCPKTVECKAWLKRNGAALQAIGF